MIVYTLLWFKTHKIVTLGKIIHSNSPMALIETQRKPFAMLLNRIWNWVKKDCLVIGCLLAEQWVCLFLYVLVQLSTVFIPEMARLMNAGYRFCGTCFTELHSQSFSFAVMKGKTAVQITRISLFAQIKQTEHTHTHNLLQLHTQTHT